MFPLGLVGTNPDLHPSRLKTGGQDRGGDKTDWGCVLGAPARALIPAALSARFLLFGYAKQAGNSPRAATACAAQGTLAAPGWMRPLRGGEDLVWRGLCLAQPSL